MAKRQPSERTDFSSENLLNRCLKGGDLAEVLTDLLGSKSANSVQAEAKYEPIFFA